MVNLALTHRIELGQPRDFDRPRGMSLSLLK
jgi:hypothetical protein